MIQRQVDAETNGEATFLPYTAIVGHEYVRGKANKYRGSAWNVQVKWDDGTKTWEPLGIMIKDDPYTMAEYAMEHDLLGREGWKRLRKHAKPERRRRLIRMSSSTRPKDQTPRSTSTA